MEWKFKELIRFDSSRARDIALLILVAECEADLPSQFILLDSTDARWR